MIAAFDEAAAGPMKGILGVCHEPLVSMDFKGDTRSSIIDADFVHGDRRQHGQGREPGTTTSGVTRAAWPT